MKVLVYGGTGSQGSAIVQKLLAQGHDAYVLTRQPEKAAHLAEQGAHIVQGDMADLASLRAASTGMDAIALTITFIIPDRVQAVRYGQNAIDAAKATGVKRIVYNTSGPVLAEPIGNAGYDMRPEVIAYLKASGVPYIVFAPTTYLENLLGPWTRQGIIEQNTLAYPAEAHAAIGWIATRDLAALIVAALEHPEVAPAEWAVSGVENLTGTALAARFSEGLGREIAYYPLPLDAFGAALDEMLGAGASEGVLPGYRLLRDHPEKITNWTDMRPILEKLPVQMTNVVDWVREHAFLFSAESVSKVE
ncbi:MAG: SDR family oxidoreductase [Anaerolineae bacterium]